ncbi:hypothetical protein MRS44_017510 [Fusarium solani]|uniref:uncharacterized protein n=1 Tax=Fusarium solani TaxID=169388 RepID=UPI0032C3DA96|nr:hypothetical protein MRS44_017510 [Fusarium solani]
MNNTDMANMNAMTGHVHDALRTMMNSCAVAPHGALRHLQENYNKQTQLNTYIYEYFLRYDMFDCAQAILKADSDVKLQRHSPRSPRDNNGCRLGNTRSYESIDIALDSKRSEFLPAPNLPNLSPESCFLYEWFCLFWDMFNAQKNDSRDTQQQTRLRWNASRSQTQSSSLLPHAPDGTTYDAFYNPGEMGVGYMTPGNLGGQAGGRRNRALQEFQVQLSLMGQQNKKELIARQDTSGQTIRQPVAAEETQFQQQEKTGQNGSVQWQGGPNENQIPQAAQRGVQGTLQQRSRRPSFKPAHANDSPKPRRTIPSPPQTSKAASPTPQFSKAARRKGPVPRGTTLKKGTKNVKNEAVTQKIPKSNVSSGATPAAKTTPSPVPHVNPVGPAVPLPLPPAPMVANHPVDLVQSVTLSMENPNMTDFACLPTFDGDLHGFDFDSFLESSAEDLGVFHFPFNMDVDDIAWD